MAKHTQIAIYGHPLTERTKDTIGAFLLAMKERNISFFIQEGYWKDIQEKCAISLECITFNHRDEIRDVDFFSPLVAMAQC